MQWRLILKEFGTNIQCVAGVDKIVSHMLSRLPYTPVNKNKTRTAKAQLHRNYSFSLGGDKHNKYRIS